VRGFRYQINFESECLYVKEVPEPVRFGAERIPRLFVDLALARSDGRHLRLCARSAASIFSSSMIGVSSRSPPPVTTFWKSAMTATAASATAFLFSSVAPGSHKIEIQIAARDVGFNVEVHEHTIPCHASIGHGTPGGPGGFRQRRTPRRIICRELHKQSSAPCLSNAGFAVMFRAKLAR